MRAAAGTDPARARTALSALVERYRGPVRAYLLHDGIRRLKRKSQPFELDLYVDPVSAARTVAVVAPVARTGLSVLIATPYTVLRAQPALALAETTPCESVVLHAVILG